MSHVPDVAARRAELYCERTVIGTVLPVPCAHCLEPVREMVALRLHTGTVYLCEPCARRTQELLAGLLHLESKL